MSQPSNQALDPSWVSVSFAKFSYNSSPLGTRNFTWNHVGSRNDLDFILRNTRVLDERGNFQDQLLMKINAGAEELEQQNLYELVQHAQASDPSSGGESPVQVVVKSPFLALRYPKSADIVRRIQLKFHNDSDFTKILNLMKNLGLPITATIPPAPQFISRPSISPSPSLLSDISNSTSLTLPSTLSASSVSAFSGRISLPTPGSSFHPAIAANNNSFNDRSSSSTSDFKVPMRPNSSFSGTQNLASSSISPSARPATTSNCFPLHSPGLPHALLTPKLPTSVYIAQLEREFQSRRSSLPGLPALPTVKTSQQDPPSSLSLYRSQIDLQGRSASECNQNSDHQLSQSPFFPPRTLSPGLRESLNKASLQDFDRQEPDTLESQRRNPAMPHSAQSTELSIPPRRELPFPKPREVIPRSASISALPPLPRPTLLPYPKSVNMAKNDQNSASVKTSENVAIEDQGSASVGKPAKRRVAQRKATSVKQPDIADPPSDQGQGNKGDASTSSQALPRGESSPLAAKSFVAAAGLQSKTAAPKKRVAPARPSSATKRAKMVDQSTQTEKISYPDRPTAFQSLSNQEMNAPITTHQSATPAASAHAAPATTPESYLDAVDAFVTKCKDRRPPQELWERPGWAEVEVEQRQLLLNEFICQNLENKDFLKLCEDMAVSWRRIVLGMG